MVNKTGVKMPLFHKLFTIALGFPILYLMGIMGINEYQLRKSQTLTLPIQGYDPRDLLSGYYLRYKVKYGVKCPKKNKSKTERRFKLAAYVCFKPEKSITYSPSEKCSLFIKGKCDPFTNEFQSKNINRYYIPERAKELERLFTSAKKQEVILSVTKKGQALVKDVLIDGESIKKLINRL